MTNILVVEDNAGMRGLMRIHLSRAGYQVLEAADGKKALDAMEHNRVDLIVADVMMPNMDGLELTRELRSAGTELPILIVTARDTLDDKRTGFRAGADDYLTKPLDMEEMLLHIEALLRRWGKTVTREMKVGGCTLRPESLTVTGEGYCITLRQKEYLLLEKLLSYPGRVFTRAQLLDELWGYDCDSDPRTVDSHIKQLRKKLKNADSIRIQTIRGLVYRAAVPKQK